MAKGSLERLAGNQEKGAICFFTAASAAYCKGLPVVSSVSYTAFLSLGLGRYRRKSERELQRSSMGKWQGPAACAELESRGSGNTGAFSVPDRFPMQVNEISLFFPTLKIITLLRRKVAACAWETGDTILQSHSFFYLSMTWIRLNPKWLEWKTGRKDCLRQLKKPPQPPLSSDTLKES